MSVEVCRGADRYRVVQPGIETWHSFSAGAHYDPANVAFGPLIAFDEHLLAPGAAFDRHPHRGVEIVSYVVEGVLRHEDDSGLHDVPAGRLQHQSTGTGIHHVERNASEWEPVRFLQMWLLAHDPQAAAHYATVDAANGVRAGAAELLVHNLDVGDKVQLDAPRSLVFVVRGAVCVGAAELSAGDAGRVVGEAVRVVAGTPGLVLVWRLPG